MPTQKYAGGTLSYYVAHWERYQRTRRVVWGQQREVASCTGRF